ncbi:MAG: DUF4270 family protein, partial [Bacteroidota bacterium]
VNFITNNFDSSIMSAIQSSNDQVNGEENLYLKGGQGSMALIDLFGKDLDGNGEPDSLTALKEKNWIINDASLVFHVNQDIVDDGSGIPEPERILIFDLENNSVLADYQLNGRIAALNEATTHLGRLERVDNSSETSDGVSYKIRLTEHINNIRSGDSENVRLGLVVSQNVTLLSNSSVQNQTSPISIESIPTSAAYSHEGTVLYGNLASDPDKRLKLEVHYTEIED